MGFELGKGKVWGLREHNDSDAGQRNLQGEPLGNTDVSEGSPFFPYGAERHISLSSLCGDSSGVLGSWKGLGEGEEGSSECLIPDGHTHHLLVSGGGPGRPAENFPPSL